MHTIVENYYTSLLTFLTSVQATDRGGNVLPFYDGVEIAVHLILSMKNSFGKLMFIGNGASAAISSHMAADFSKNAEIRTLTFHDIALVTAVSNDLGYEQVFEKPITMYADEGDIVCAISSSGRSENILRGVRAAQNQGCQIISLSGFESDNPLRAMGHINFYVPAHSYGPVEVVHHSICHCILDTIMKVRHG